GPEGGGEGKTRLDAGQPVPRPPARQSRARGAADRASFRVCRLEQGGLLRGRLSGLDLLIDKYQAVAVAVRLDQLDLGQEPATARPNRLDRQVGIGTIERGGPQGPAFWFRRTDHLDRARLCAPVTPPWPAQHGIVPGRTPP